jgi:branched-chain amino acid transport system ATP-binding protein
MANGNIVRFGNFYPVVELANRPFITKSPRPPQSSTGGIDMKSDSLPLVRFRDVRVQFDGVVAVDLVHLDLFTQSRLEVLVGPNGAGKSSMINAATGYARVRRPGKIILENGDSFELSRFSRDRIVRAGVARTFQMPALFPSLTVEESLLLAAVLGKPGLLARRLLSLLHVPKHDRKSATLVESLIKEFGLESVAQARMDELSFVMLRRAELARALAVQPRILFLDEPSAGADETEIGFLIGLLTRKLPDMIRSLFEEGLYRYADVSVGLVTHDLVLLKGLAHACPDEPMAHYFEGGQLKTTCRLQQWLSSMRVA